MIDWVLIVSKTTINSQVLADLYQHAVRLEEESRFLKEAAIILQGGGHMSVEDACELEGYADCAHDDAVEILQIIREAD